MSDTASSNESGEAAETAEVTAPAAEQATTPSKVEDLPEFAQNLIKDLRNENAAARVKKNEAVESSKSEVTKEFEAKLAEADTAHTASKVELLRVQTDRAKAELALETLLGDETAKKVRGFARAIQGADEEEMKAHATELKSLFGISGEKETPSAVDPTQGYNGAQTQSDDFGSFIQGLWNK